jgi:hypothetical protein
MEHVTRQAGAAGRCDHTRGMGVPADRNRGGCRVAKGGAGALLLDRKQARYR